MQIRQDTYKPDFTAWFVLQGTVVARHVLNDSDGNDLKLYELFAKESSKTRSLSNFISILPYKLQYVIGEIVTNRGRLRHFHLRKKEIKKRTLNILSDGIQQVVVLGSGMDALTMNMTVNYPQIEFIEIDQHESQSFKKKVLYNNNIPIPQNIEIIGGDLREPLSEIMRASKKFDKHKKTLWIAEGLFMFIAEYEVIRIFKEIKNNSLSNSYVIFTTLRPNAQGSKFGLLIQKFFRRKEKFSYNWSIYPENVFAFIENINLKMTEQIDCLKLHSAFGNNNPNIGDDINIAVT